MALGPCGEGTAFLAQKTVHSERLLQDHVTEYDSSSLAFTTQPAEAEKGTDSMQWMLGKQPGSHFNICGEKSSKSVKRLDRPAWPLVIADSALVKTDSGVTSLYDRQMI